MKNGIDLFLVIVLLATIGLLVYFGVSESTQGQQPYSVSTISAEAATVTETSFPTSSMTAALIPNSVTDPTKTTIHSHSPKETGTNSVPDIKTNLTGIITPVSSLDQEINTGIKRGNRIVQAIEAYFMANGKYPPALKDLSPAYLSDIPLTSTGQAYFYRLFDGGGPLADEMYWVSFKAINQDHVACTYFKRLKTWDCDFNSP